MSDRSKIVYAKNFLRRKYASDLAGLKTFADEVFGSATDEVTVTSTSFTGGNASGQITFERHLLGTACEELLQELDPTNFTPPGLVPRRPSGIRCQL